MNSGELNLKRVYSVEGRITLSGLNNSSTCKVPANSVLICLAGQGKTRGTVAITYLELCTNQSIASILPNSEVFNSEYLYQNLDSRYDELRELSTGDGGRGGLNLTIIRRLSVFLPPLPEQHLIAAALSETDSYITALEKLIAKKHAIKQGAMQELLTGKRRLPGFDGEWMEKMLGELLKYEQPTNYIVSNTEYSDNGIPVLTAGKSLVLGYTNDNTGIYDNLPVIIFDDFTTESKFINYRFKVKSSAIKLLTTTGLSNIRLIYALMQMIEFPLKDHQRYWISEYSKISVKIPQDKAEQIAIATILSDMDAEIDTLTAKLNKVRHIKQGMMSELLMGRIRLTEEKTVEKAEVPEFSKQEFSAEKMHHKHSEGFDETVILVALVKAFGTEEYPFTAFDCQKFPYLFHRHLEGVAKGYKKFAAGPYNPGLEHETAIPIALGKDYIRKCVGKYKGYVISNNAQISLNYFSQWYGDEPLKWLEQFRYIRNRRDELELLTTVDMAMVELRQENKQITVSAIKEIIQKSKEWKAKLKRELFSDANIVRAINWSNELFGQEVTSG